MHLGLQCFLHLDATEGFSFHCFPCNPVPELFIEFDLIIPTFQCSFFEAKFLCPFLTGTDNHRSDPQFADFDSFLLNYDSLQVARDFAEYASSRNVRRTDVKGEWVATWMNEQALREIYLKSFEIVFIELLAQCDMVLLRHCLNPNVVSSGLLPHLYGSYDFEFVVENTHFTLFAPFNRERRIDVSVPKRLQQFFPGHIFDLRKSCEAPGVFIIIDGDLVSLI